MVLTLGIESSCDDTAVALVENGRRVLSSVVASQSIAHQRTGGVIPEVAAREHLEVIRDTYCQALSEAGLGASAIDAICVTQGPGLMGSLLVGTSFAKGLALALAKPVVPVNHVHAHVYGSLLEYKGDSAALFPALALVVSGGHTHVYAMAHPLDFNLVAESIDDACGECFDKVAKLLGLGYPGGPAIERLAREGSPRLQMPAMMSKPGQEFNFSFSGLKTHMLYLLEKEEQPIVSPRLNDICASFQREAIGQIIRKVAGVSQRFCEYRTVIVAGGVAANGHFRSEIAKLDFTDVILPKLAYCSDNGAMIAALGHAVWQASSEPKLFAELSWEAFARYAERACD